MVALWVAKYHTLNILDTLGGTLAQSAVRPSKVGFASRNNNGSTSSSSNVAFVSGWAGVNMGSPAPNKNISIGFGVTFATPPIVVASYGGDQTSGSISYGAGGTVVKRGTATARSVTTTGFTAVIDSLDGSSWASGNNIYVQWVAIGEQA